MLADAATALGVLATLGFVFVTLAVVAYALVRPFTHTHYRHPTERLWKPLD